MKVKREELNQSQLDKSDTKSKVRSKERYCDQDEPVVNLGEDDADQTPRQEDKGKEYHTPEMFKEDKNVSNKFSNIIDKEDLDVDLNSFNEIEESIDSSIDIKETTGKLEMTHLNKKDKA